MKKTSKYLIGLLGLFGIILLFVQLKLGEIRLLFGLLPLSAVLHIAEEFVFPGGFRLWYQNYRPSIASSLTAGFLVTINVILVVMCILPILLGATPQGVALWLTIAAILFSNALFHVFTSIKTRRYSPGLIT